MDIILKYFPSLTGEQIKQIRMLGKLYPEWNNRINVISRKDIEHLYLRHVLHSMSIARYIRFHQDCRVMDAGTGGGFPGIPLAILFPESSFCLVDSTAKKLKVIDEIATSLGLKNVETRHSRLEDFNDSFDFVVSRAVATIPQMMNWVGKNIEPGNRSTLPNGLLYLKGGDFMDELKSIPQKFRIYNLQDIFDEDFFETKKLIHIRMA